MTREEAKQIIITEYCKNRVFCELYREDCKEDECEIYHALKALKAEPIRCKDCKYHIQSECRSPWLRLPDFISPIKTADSWFCADGARMDEVEE